MPKLHHYLPESIQVKDKTYKPHCSASYFMETNGLQKEKERLKQQGYLVRTLHVLSRNHRGVTDNHGRLYKPLTWLFIHKKKPTAKN